MIYALIQILGLEAVAMTAIYLVARKADRRPRAAQIPLVLAPVMTPLACLAWSWMSGPPVPPGGVGRTGLAVEMFSYLIYASFAAALAVPVLAKGYRTPTAVLALFQIPLTYMIGLGGAMAATGVYL